MKIKDTIPLESQEELIKKMRKIRLDAVAEDHTLDHIRLQEKMYTELLELCDYLLGPLRSTILKISQIKSYYYAKQYQSSEAKRRLHSYQNHADSAFSNTFFRQTDFEVLSYTMSLPFSGSFSNNRKKHEQLVVQHMTTLDKIADNIDKLTTEQHHFLNQVVPLICHSSSQLFKIAFELSAFHLRPPFVALKDSSIESKMHQLQELIRGPGFNNVIQILYTGESKGFMLRESEPLYEKILATNQLIHSYLTTLKQLNTTKSEDPNSPYQLHQQLQATYQSFKSILDRLTETFPDLASNIRLRP